MLGIALVHTVLMTIFVVDLVHREKMFFLDLSQKQAFGLAKTLATNATSWVLARDFIGMEEIIISQSGFPNLRFAMLVDAKGQVLAYTDTEQVGKYIDDEISRTLLTAKPEPYILVNDSDFIDTAAPIIVNKRQIGWARVGISRAGISDNIKQVTRNGLLYMLIAIIVGTFFAWFMARGLTTDIRKLVSRANQLQHGEKDIDFFLEREDELGTMAQRFQELNKTLLIQVDNLQREITAKKNAIDKRDQIEGRLRKAIDIIDNSYAVVFRWKNEEGWPVEYVSKNVKDIFGYPAETFISSKIAYSDFIHPDDLARVAKEVEQHIKTKGREDFILKPYRVIAIDGSRKWLEGKINIVRNDKGDVTHFEGIVLDISFRVEVQEKAAAMEMRLRQAQKMEAIGTLAGGIAHDFNNILAAIIGYTDLAKLHVTPGTTIERDLEQVLIAGDRAKRLIKQILAFSRQVEVERVFIRIQPLLKEGLKLIRSSLPSTISIITDIDPYISPVWADPTQVHQILMNLCTNASQAMETSGGTLSVSLQNVFIQDDDQPPHVHLAPGEYAELTVADTGVGIDPDIIERIFDPYFTTKCKEKGTGLGLAIIHGVISDYGGAITVESELGKGATFHVFFPVTEKTEDAELQKTKELEDIPHGTERILFVDDEELLINMGKDMLSQLGYHVIVKKSSLEALETFNDQPDNFDLVITDQTMPDMTGLELAKNMLQIRPNLPIILCTGYSTLVDEKMAKNQGVKKFLLKPVKRKNIAQAIRQVLDGDEQAA
ncbi:MAG: ATP-binding protein [Candidatus Electrothrix sp. GW3-4]|uniref:ATP-binding protein n=1 Tax=Candidatus Electrothrix sp. GW3-4 TaxID=3126740 RepID=UPI0030CE7005